MWWIVVIVVLFMCMGGSGMVVRLVEGRRRFALDLKREEARIAEARARELELEHKRAELQYREALLELERFDRRAGLGRPLPPELDPTYPGDPTDPVSPAAGPPPAQPPGPSAGR